MGADELQVSLGITETVAALESFMGGSCNPAPGISSVNALVDRSVVHEGEHVVPVIGINGNGVAAGSASVGAHGDIVGDAGPVLSAIVSLEDTASVGDSIKSVGIFRMESGPVHTSAAGIRLCRAEISRVSKPFFTVFRVIENLGPGLVEKVSRYSASHAGLHL